MFLKDSLLARNTLQLSSVSLGKLIAGFTKLALLAVERLKINLKNILYVTKVFKTRGQELK